MELLSSASLDPSWDAIIVDIDIDGQLGSVAEQIDASAVNQLVQLSERGELAGNVGDVTLLHFTNALLPKLVSVVGIGHRSAVGPTTLYRAFGAGVKSLAGRQRQSIALGLDKYFNTASRTAAIAGAMNGGEGQDLYRSTRRLFPPKEIYVNNCSDLELSRGRAIGHAIRCTRRLVNEPPNKIYPESLADQAAEMAKAFGLECEIWDRQRLEKENCRALLAVSAGSDAEPRMIVLRHRGSTTKSPELALVGKGVTFDSGGLSIKPTDGMKDMKCDMAGAASVIGAMQAIAELKVPRHVVGLIGAVENMLGGKAYKLGDVIKTRSGKTIEILNTDAEGRVVLADVLDVAAEMNPTQILDLATLTGACIVALGTETIGMMTNDEPWGTEVLAAAKRSGEPMWQLPMFSFFDEQIRSQIADIKNVGEGRWAGAITAAKFLQEFVRDIPWVHLDIAGPAYSEQSKAWRDAGATGVPVRTLIELVLSLGSNS